MDKPADACSAPWWGPRASHWCASRVGSITAPTWTSTAKGRKAWLPQRPARAVKLGIGLLGVLRLIAD